MKKIITFAMLGLTPLWALAIDLYRPVGGRSTAMGGTSVSAHDVWAWQNNPAGTAYLHGWQAGLYYENRWMLRETAFKSAVLARSIEGVGCLGLSVNQFGGTEYSENKLGLGYARAFGPYLQLGLHVDGIWLHWGEGYRDRRGLSFALGMQSQLTERLRIGACVFNPLQIGMARDEGRLLPMTMRVGLSYRFTDGFVGQGEWAYDHSRHGMRLGGGFEYAVSDRFSLRAGAQYHPNLVSFGAGYRIGSIHVDVSGQLHQLLGASVQVSLVYQRYEAS
ncbi:MAG: hypothetical protein J6X40_04235 [Bacteroidales bacterium]|nr:hypothetical protein [Bacteroidales bacterium]